MANISTPFGFQPYGVATGSPPTEGYTRRQISTSNGTAIYRGDPVTSLNTGFVAQSTAGTTQLAGIFWGCSYTSIAQKGPVQLPNWPGSTTDVVTGTSIFAWVIDNPDQLFVCATGNGGPVTFASIGNNINFALGTGNSTTGLSGAYADFATIGTTATLPWRIQSLYSNQAPPGQNGTDNTTQYNWIVVAPNNWDRNSTTGI
jgi:hypothetical protein